MEKSLPNVKHLSKEDFSNICRLCLIQDPVASIFDLKYEETSFSEILFELFFTKMNSEDELPKNVCESCISKSVYFYNFRKVFVASEKILQGIITKDLNRTLHIPILDDTEIKLDFESTMTISNNDLSGDLIKEDPDIKTYGSSDQVYKLEDQIISAYNSNEDEIQINRITTDNISTTDVFLADRDDSGKLPEDFILETLNSDFQVRRLDDGAKTKRKPLQPKIFTCSCQKTFTLKSELMKHRKEEKHQHLRDHTCKICGRNFTIKALLRYHIHTHTKEKPYECKICLARFSQPGNLHRHMKVHTGVKPHMCEFCGKGFIQSARLSEHRRTHTGEKPFLCMYCGKIYGHRRSYQTHLKQHRDGNKIKCQFCPKRFPTKAVLDNHLLYHGEKRFLCNYCGMKFHTNGTLETHLRLHTGEKPYACTLCPKKFAQRTALQDHVWTHTEDKPFKCTICSKACIKKSHLQVHMRTHSGEKPYACPHCNKTFTNSGTLRVHIRTHTGETPYMCDLCHKGFYDCSSMKRHRKRHLPESKIEKKSD